MNEQLAALLPSMQYNLPYLGTTDVAPYVTAVLVFLVAIAVFRIVQMVIVSRLKAFSRKTTTDVDDVVIGAVEGVRTWVYVLIALYIALIPFELPHIAQMVLDIVFWFAVVWQLIEIGACFVDYGAKRFLEKDEDGDGVVDPNAATASHMLTLLARIALWTMGLLFVLSNLGVEITSLIAGLGIGGVAVAFALQGILSDLFASFSLYFDKPFRIGDFIVIGEHSGVVERIGIKTTRIRTLQGEELVVSNAELTTTRVQNFKRMSERRIVFHLGVTYDTPAEKLEKIRSIVASIFEETEGARLDRVHFTTFADFALTYEIVYYVASPDYNAYLDAQEAVNLALYKRFAAEGIEFAYPTQTLFVKKD